MRNEKTIVDEPLIEEFSDYSKLFDCNAQESDTKTYLSWVAEDIKYSKNPDLAKLIFLEEYSIPKKIHCYQDLYSQINKSLNNYNESYKDLLDHLLGKSTKEIIDQLKSFQKNTEKEHKAILKEEKNILKEIEILKKENNDLRNLLDEKYSAKSLLYTSLTTTAALSFSLYAWYLLDIPLINPVLSIPLLIASIGFLTLSYWRLK